MSSGYCFWEKTLKGCKDDNETFVDDAYDFYELCRAGEKRKGAEFHCDKAPAKLTAGQCNDRDEGVAKNGHEQKESSSGKADDKDGYAYLDKTTQKTFCVGCEQSRSICRRFGSCGICRSGALKGG